MRLWHEYLIPVIDRQRLLSQHRECCALRGNGWGRKHSTVDYAFKYPMEYLVAYHYKVMNEMQRRGYKPNEVWYSADYRGKECLPQEMDVAIIQKAFFSKPVYPEHDRAYLRECLEILAEKGAELLNID